MPNIVSIVIPAYNAEKYLERSLNSIRKQTYPHWEAIIVDDGSEDGTYEAAKRFAETDGRFRPMSVKHGGVSAARNYGLSAANGEYLQFMDADDELEADCLETLVNMLERDGSDLAICRFSHPFFKTYIEDRVFDIGDKNDFISLYSDCFAMVLPWNRMWRRRCFCIPFEVDLKFSEDEIGNLANIFNALKISSTHKCLYHYYLGGPDEHDKSCIRSIIAQKDFWKKGTSLYNLGANLTDKRRDIIRNAISRGIISIDSCEDIMYARLMDYCFWQLPLYIGMNIPTEGLVAEYTEIFRDKRFIDGMKSRQKYGILLKSLTDEKKDRLSRCYVTLCEKAFADAQKDSTIEVIDVFIMYFLRLFTECRDPLDTVDIYARLWAELRDGSTAAARYVNKEFGEDGSLLVRDPRMF